MENTDYYQTVENFNTEEGKRPGGLIVLCVLTFIGSGFAFLGKFFSFAFRDFLLEFMEIAVANMDGAMEEMYRKSIDIFASTPQYIFLISAILYIFSISGAAIMLAMRKIGFHIYATAQIFIVFMPQLLSKSPFDVMSFFFAMAFIALYFMYYKRMK